MTEVGQVTAYIDSTGKPLAKAPDSVRPGACAVIFDDDGKVLLEHRSDNGFWGLPGGAVEVGESVEQAVEREVMEETALQVDVKRLVGVYSDPRHYNISSYPDGNVVHWVTVVFECIRVDGELRISDESTDIRYFNVEDLPENTLRSHALRVSDAMNPDSGPFIR